MDKSQDDSIDCPIDSNLVIKHTGLFVIVN